MNEIEEAIGHLGAAMAQQSPSDDKIIMDHVRAAHDLLRRARAAFSKANTK